MTVTPDLALAWPTPYSPHGDVSGPQGVLFWDIVESFSVISQIQGHERWRDF